MIERELTEEAHPAWYRVIVPAYATMPRSGAGAARQGGRFSRPGQEALYLCADAHTALDECRADNPWLPPGTICTFFVHGLRVADLSNGFDPGRWHTGQHYDARTLGDFLAAGHSRAGCETG
jgi:hypothetical protein